MTIGGYVVAIIISVVLLGIGLGVCYTCFSDRQYETAGAITLIAAVILTILTWVGMRWYYQNTASGQRALKTQKSELNNGIERIIVVYDINGQIIEKYEGKFDIEYKDERIMFDDTEGNRHIIYFKTGTVIVHEVNED